MQELVSDRLVPAGPDQVDQHVIGLRPGAALDLHLVAVGRQIQVVHRQSPVGVHAQTGVVLHGSRSPQIQETERIVVVGQLPVPRQGPASVPPVVAERAPILLDELQNDAHVGQGRTQIPRYRRVSPVGVVQIGQRGEVQEGPRLLVEGVVPFQDLHCGVAPTAERPLRYVEIPGDAVQMARPLTERRPVRLRHPQRDQGRGRDLSPTGDLPHDLLPVEQEGDGRADLLPRPLRVRPCQRGGRGEDLRPGVPAEEIGPHLSHRHELPGPLRLQKVDGVVGHGVQELDPPRPRPFQTLLPIGREEELDPLHGDGVRPRMVRILLKDEGTSRIPVGDRIRPVAHEGPRIGRPAVAGHHVLPYGHVRRPRQELSPVRHVLVERDRQRPLVRGLHRQTRILVHHAPGLVHPDVLIPRHHAEELMIPGGQSR